MDSLFLSNWFDSIPEKTDLFTFHSDITEMFRLTD